MNIFAKSVAVASVVATSLAASTAVQAQNKVDGTRLGVLDCTIEGGIGLLIGSSKAADCTFTLKDGKTEQYTGSLGKLGIDIGVSEESVIRWIVFTPTGQEFGDYALAGKYVGVSAGASLGIGLGANALVGGQAKKIGLQPFSVEGKKGINVSAGLARLSLEALK